MARLILALAVAFMLLGTATADAGTFTSERAMADRTALHEAAMGVAWWHQHGVTGCPDGVALKVASGGELKADLLAGADLEQRREWGPEFEVYELASIEAPHRGGCEIWMARSVYDIYGTQRRFYELNRTCRATAGPGERRYYCSDRTTVEDMRVEQALRCSIMRHALGHAIGGLGDDEISTDPDITETMAQSDMVPMYADCEDLARLTWRYKAPRRSVHRHNHLTGSET